MRLSISSTDLSSTSRTKKSHAPLAAKKRQHQRFVSHHGGFKAWPQNPLLHCVGQPGGTGMLMSQIESVGAKKGWKQLTYEPKSLKVYKNNRLGLGVHVRSLEEPNTCVYKNIILHKLGQHRATSASRKCSLQNNGSRCLPMHDISHSGAPYKRMCCR